MLQVNCELHYVKLFDKVSMSVVAIFWITWFSEEFLSDVKKIRPNKMGERNGCVSILAFVMYGLKDQEQSQSTSCGR